MRYRFLLADAAAAAKDADVAEDFGGAIVAPASSWALHPGSRAAVVRFHGAGPGAFLSGAPPAEGAATYESRATGLRDSAYSGFGAWRTKSLAVAGQPILVGIAPGARAMSDDEVAQWIAGAAAPLAAYFGHLGAERPLVLVVPGEGSAIDGKTLGGGGVSVLLRLGPEVTAKDAADSWVATHELVHANLPSFGYPHEWFEEGVATYVEPIARVRAGPLPEDTMWRDLIEGLPNGLPGPGDEGLESTHTWGRTYWGGALYCFVADVAIRERTHGARSLDDALRAIAALSRGGASRVELARALATGDAATGTTALEDLYRRLAEQPGAVDLAAEWRALGVTPAANGRVIYDDRAPLAWIRRSITAR